MYINIIICFMVRLSSLPLVLLMKVLSGSLLLKMSRRNSVSPVMLLFCSNILMTSAPILKVTLKRKLLPLSSRPTTCLWSCLSTKRINPRFSVVKSRLICSCLLPRISWRYVVLCFLVYDGLVVLVWVSVLVCVLNSL